MSRQNLKDLIELVAALGVIVTLAFVALEIRQNTDVARSATAQAIAEQSYDAVMRLVDNNELRAAYLAGFDGELSSEQEQHLRMFYTAVIRLQLNRHEQIKLGIIDLELALNLGGRGDGYGSPYFVEFWTEIRERYPADFQEYIEKHVIRYEENYYDCQ